jgi:hypothetical protein
MDDCRGGQAVCCTPLRYDNTLGKGGASPSRCIPPKQGTFRGPRAPHDEEPGPVPQPSPNRAPVGYGQAFAPDTTTRERDPAPYDPPQPYADWMRGKGTFPLHPAPELRAPAPTASALPRWTGIITSPRLTA